jgi:hypothetical protein
MGPNNQHCIKPQRCGEMIRWKQPLESAPVHISAPLCCHEILGRSLKIAGPQVSLFEHREIMRVPTWKGCKEYMRLGVTVPGTVIGCLTLNSSVGATLLLL